MEFDSLNFKSIISLTSIRTLARIIQTPTLEHRYDHVTMFGNHEISLALFVLIFLAGGLDCTTSVVFFPVARRLSNDKTYITALMLGEAMTGLLTSTLSTLQSLNDYKILSIKTFFVILSVIVIIATMSFRYIETKMMSMKENRSNVPRRMDEMKLFLGQAALAFVENGLHTTLLPHALASFPHSDTNISIATKLGTCTQRDVFIIRSDHFISQVTPVQVSVFFAHTSVRYVPGQNGYLLTRSYS